MKQARPIHLFFFFFFLLSLSSCFRSIGDQLGAGFLGQLNDEELQKVMDRSSRTVVKAAMEEFLKDSLQQEFRANLDSLLGQTSDTMSQMSNQLVETFMGKYTEEWLAARSQELSDQLIGTLQKMKGEMLNDDLANYLRDLSRNVLKAELTALSDELILNLTDEASLSRIGNARSAISLELDTLIEAAFRSAAGNYTNQFAPIVDSLQSQAGTVINEADTTSKSIIRNLAFGIGGLIVLILLAFLAYSLVWQRRYKSMLSIITKNIDQVPSQESYDQLTHAIRNEMDQKGYEPYLRELLKEQELLEQKKWQDKDHQLLRLISKSLSDQDEGEKVSLSDIENKAQDLGLEEHLRSVINRIKEE